MIATVPNVNMKDIARFLACTFNHPTIQDKYLCLWTVDDNRSRFFKVADRDSALRYAAQRAEDTDVYVRTTLLDAPPQGGRGCADDSTVLVGVWIDVDIAHIVHKKQNLPPDMDTAMDLLDGFGISPSVVLHSGYGLHAWTLFDEPWVLESTDDRQRAMECVGRYQARIRELARDRGYVLDSTQDLARLLRIPGCLNHKLEPRPVRFVRCTEARYSIDEISRHFTGEPFDCGEQARQQEAAREPVPVGQIITEDQCSRQPLSGLQALLARCPRLKSTWERNRPDMADSSPSAYDLALANLLVDEGASDEEIVSACYAHRILHGDGTDKLFRAPNKTGSCYQLDLLKKARSPARKQGRRSDFPLTDLGNAERLAALHGRDLKYVRYRGDKGEWYYWTGQRWSLDNIGFVTARAKATVRSIYREASQTDDDNRRRELAQHARRSESHQRITAMAALARSESPIPVGSAVLDSKPWLLNVKNGTIDLRTGALREHNRDDYLTRLCDVVYDPHAACPRWEQFVREIMGGNERLVEFLRRLMGMCLTGDVSEHILVIFYGEGRNGKSTFLDVFLDLLGDHAMPAPASLLCTRKGSNDHPTDVAALWGKRLVVASESDEGSALKTSLVKSLTGDQFIEARFMHQDNFKFARTHKTILVTNNKPVIYERSAAIWERVKLVPFTQQFTGEKADKRLAEKLREEYPGILAWAVRGCVKWQQERSLAIPSEVVKATDEYQAEEDQVAAFIEDCCTVDASARVGRKELWSAYSQWAHAAGEMPLTQKGFYERLRTKGFKETRLKVAGASARGFSGIKVTAITDGLTQAPDSGHMES